MTFTIARDILSKISQAKLGEKAIRQLAVEFDYFRAIKYIRQMEELIQLINLQLIDFTTTSALTELVDIWIGELEYYEDLFIDNQLNNHFKDMIQNHREYAQLHASSFDSTSFRKVKLDNTDTILNVAKMHCTTHPFDYAQLEALVKEFIKSYKVFKEYVTQRKTTFEIRY